MPVIAVCAAVARYRADLRRVDEGAKNPRDDRCCDENLFRIPTGQRMETMGDLYGLGNNSGRWFGMVPQPSIWNAIVTRWKVLC